MWPDMKIVHGRARHPQSQGSTERANSDIKKMIATWMRENRSLKWSIGCKFVQLQKNHTYHSANKKSPYETCFGIETPMGLKATRVELWKDMKSAKDLFRICGVPYDDLEDDQKILDFDDDDEDENVDDVFEFDKQSVQSEPEPEPTLNDENREALLKKHVENLMGVRASTIINQRAQADRMLKRSAKYQCEVEIGAFVIVPIPDVDRSAAAAPNLICRVIDFDEEKNIYELASQAGVLNVMFSRNGFDKLNSKDLNVEVRTDVAVSVREAANAVDIAGGQGMAKCNCNGQCANGRCSCKKAKLLCNSRCHSSNQNCKNK
jgi:hypothetical protein